ncbi:MAG: dihydropteroate synthase [Muribaculaceae bacterium]|nr:dihydropteroate synthase [Muribaculaceae bacterium]
MRTYNIRGHLHALDRPVVMGIINVTPDSFYPGSRTPDSDVIRRRAETMRHEGADWLDIGGYSTRPGAQEVSEAEETDRLCRGLEAVREVWPEAVVSVDTFRARVARECVERGADIINDISGGTLDPDMWPEVARLKVPYILMHTRGTPATMQSLTDYDDVAADVLSDMMHKVAALRQLGVADIILDPGFGFAKTPEQNYTLLSSLPVFAATGLPLLAGLSRKSMIWRPLGITPAEALPGTIALNAAALLYGADILRVHDVAEARQTADVISLLKKHTLH